MKRKIKWRRRLRGGMQDSSRTVIYETRKASHNFRWRGLCVCPSGQNGEEGTRLELFLAGVAENTEALAHAGAN